MLLVKDNFKIMDSLKGYLAKGNARKCVNFVWMGDYSRLDIGSVFFFQ